MRKIINIIIKEFIQFRRDPKMLGISIIAPVLQLILLGYAANIDIKNLPIIICDYDKSSYSRDFLSTFSHSEYFSIYSYIDDSRKIDKYIEKGEAAIAIVIPKGFEKNLINGEQTTIQAIVDGADANTASIGSNYINILVNNYSQKLMEKKLIKFKLLNINISKVIPELRVWYNPTLKSRNFMIPGVLALILMVMTLILTSLAIVKEKEIGTLEQLIVTPIKSHQLIIGKLIPFILIGIIDVILVLLVSSLWFNIPLKGSIFLLFILCMIFLFTTLGLGLFISTVSHNQQQAMMTSIFFVMMPMMFLSGFVFPIENMPKIIQYITYLMPLRYFFVIIRGIFLKGIGISQLYDQAFFMFLIGIIIFVISILKFSKKID